MVYIIKDKNKIILLFSIDFTISPSVWLGTSTGCVIVINLNIIYEPRNISGKYLSLQLTIKKRFFFEIFSCTKWKCISFKWSIITHLFS